jgi:hypothetical protein
MSDVSYFTLPTGLSAARWSRSTAEPRRQVGWLLALENAIDVARHAAILIRMHP